VTQKSLAKLYHTLTPSERYAAIAAALARGDEPEAERLDSSAPFESGRLPHHARLGVALAIVTGRHREVLLGLTARFWKAIASSHHKTRDREGIAQCHHVALRAAAEFVLEERAFAQVCEECGVDPGDCSPLMPSAIHEFLTTFARTPPASGQRRSRYAHGSQMRKN